MDFLVAKHKIFQNPEKLPLNELFLTIQAVETERGKGQSKVKCQHEKYPALHKAFIDEQVFPVYQEYYAYAENIEDNVEIYLRKGLKYIESLDYLLRLNYHQFWCNITKNAGTVVMLKSYLCGFTPAFEVGGMDKGCAELANKIHTKVQWIFCRIFTFKHSDVEYMSSRTVLQLLEQCTLLSFPMIVNFCTAFGKTCPKLVQDAAKLYFHAARRVQWEAQTEKFLQYTSTVFEMLGGLVCGFADDAIRIPIGVPPKPAHFDPGWYEDVLTYFLEALNTLNALMSACMAMTRPATQMGIPYRLTYFYNEVFPLIYKLTGYKRHVETHEAVKQRIFAKVAMGRQECVDCFNTFAGNLINDVSLSESREEREQNVEEYLNLITAALDDDLFIFDYNNTYPINVQLELLAHFYTELDPMQTKYITVYLESLPKLEKILQKTESSERRGRRANNLRLLPPAPAAASNGYPIDESVDAPPTEEEVNEMIQTVLDTFPDLGDAFVLECLAYCDYDPVMAITLILDDNLPPSIADMQRGAIRVPPEPEPPQPIMAYRGKRPDDVNLNNADRELKDIILKAVNLQMYDDEYDDREENDPMMAPFARDASDDSSEEQEDVGGATNAGRGRVGNTGDNGRDNVGSSDGRGAGAFRPFCEDPAKLREQRELAMRGGRGRGDVVGRAKGQGQDEQVLKNRTKKTVNKAARGNHNRKRGAQWKASRGMF